MKKILCWITVFNEENQIQSLLYELEKFNTEYHIDFVIINNNSTDNSLNYIAKSKFKYYNLKKNRGIGYSLILSIKYALKKKYDILIQLAGNNKMSPNDIPYFLEMIVKKNYDYVTGSRFFKKKNYVSNPIFRIISIKILSLLFSFLFKKKITDATCGFKVFKVNIFKDKLKFFNKKKYYTYGFEYYSYGKILISNKIKHCEISAIMRYPKRGNYSHIKPIIDWVPIIKGYLEAKFDNKKIF